MVLSVLLDMCAVLFVNYCVLLFVVDARLLLFFGSSVAVCCLLFDCC